MPDQSNANNQVVIPEMQSWVARSIGIEQELQAKHQGLQDSVYKSQRLHLQDLLSFSVGRVASLQAKLKTTRKHKQQLQDQLNAAKQELEDYKQELQSTNRELCAALKKDQLTLAEAQTYAGFLLTQGIPMGEALARLLSAIYGRPVRAWELPDQSMPMVPPKTSRRKSDDRCNLKPIPLSAEGRRMQAQCQELAATAMRLQIQYQEAAAQSKALQAQFTRLTAQ